MLGLSISEHSAFHAEGKLLKPEKPPKIGDFFILNLTYCTLNINIWGFDPIWLQKCQPTSDPNTGIDFQVFSSLHGTTQSWNCWGWKIPLTLLSPTLNPALPRSPQNLSLGILSSLMSKSSLGWGEEKYSQRCFASMWNYLIIPEIWGFGMFLFSGSRAVKGERSWNILGVFPVFGSWNREGKCGNKLDLWSWGV